ncbi:putative nuclease HARBI1 [Penaeus vannamei]|uniref:putative nuclease HARBI1 n=1 Tax=Penaeus vannamei TaxID=6689 RepID=UPI00387F8FCF
MGEINKKLLRSPVPPHLQLLITLRWMATGSFQLTIADTFDVSQQLVSNCTAKIPGSVHDSRIFNNSRLFFDLQHDLLEGHHLLGDSAYPLLPFLLTPVANPVGQREVRYNISHSKARNTIERAFGVLKMRFRCLTIPLKINLTTVMTTICSAAVLHNMAVKYKEDLYMCNDDGEEESVNIEENIENFVNAAGRQKINNIINEYFS